MRSGVKPQLVVPQVRHPMRNDHSESVRSEAVAPATLHRVKLGHEGPKVQNMERKKQSTLMARGKSGRQADFC